MRVLGIIGLVFGVLSFLFWIVNWVVWTFFGGTIAVVFGLSMVSQVVGFATILFEYLAILCICIGLIVGIKNPQKS